MTTQMPPRHFLQSIVTEVSAWRVARRQTTSMILSIMDTSLKIYNYSSRKCNKRGLTHVYMILFLVIFRDAFSQLHAKVANILLVNRYIVSSKMNYEGTTFQFLIEELHTYKTSFFFQLHLSAVIFLAVAILYVYYQ